MADEGDDPRNKAGAKSNAGKSRDYMVGKGKPPKSGQFRAGDGRRRGRRTKGTCNLATDYQEEMRGLVTVTLNGQQKRVTKQRSMVMRLVDSAGRGQPGALKLALEYADKFGGAAGNAVEQSKDEELFTHLDKLTYEELRELNRLFAKASGETVDHGPQDMFAGRNDPEDPSNYVSECTVDGLIYDRSLGPFPDRLKRIENRAYRGAALPRQPGCNRRKF